MKDFAEQEFNQHFFNHLFLSTPVKYQVKKEHWCRNHDNDFIITQSLQNYATKSFNQHFLR